MSFVLLGILNSQATGAGGFQYWFSAMTHTDNTRIFKITSDSANSIIAVGRDRAGADAFAYQKYDSGGNVVFQQALTSSGNESTGGVVTDSSNNIYLGIKDGTSAGEPNLTKVNSSGVIQFQRRIPHGQFGTVGKVDIDSSDNVFISGTDFDGSNQTAILAKFNSAGTLQWDKRISQSGNVNASACATDSAGNVYIVANADQGTGDLYLAKFNSSGSVQWQRTLDKGGFEGGLSVVVDSADNVIVVGDDAAAANFDFRVLTAKFNSAGTLQWQRVLDTGSRADVADVTVDSADNIYWVGFTSDMPTGGRNGILAKYNSSGTIQWQRYIETTDTDTINGIAVNSNDDLVIGAGIRGIETPNLNTAFVGVLPNDGSLTGTYTLNGVDIIYGASTFTEGAASNTSSSVSFSVSDSGDSTVTGTLSGSTTSFVQFITEVG